LRPVIAGLSTTYTVTLTTNTLFSGSVDFDISGLPAGVGASFSPPSRTTAGTSTLTVTTTEDVVQGNYNLVITGTGGSAAGVVSTAVTLNVTGDTAQPGILYWIGTNQWSTAFNWTNVTVGGFGSPGPSNNVVFTNIATAVTSNLVNSAVDTDTTINSLVFANTNSFHNLVINSGHVLTINGTAPGYQNSPALNVGQDAGPTTIDRVYVSINGTGGTLVIDNTNASVQVRQGHGNIATV
jgi:hypothetical protein